MTTTIKRDQDARSEHIVRSMASLGDVARQRRKALQLKQTDLAGLGGTGNRFIVDLENGKPTMQVQKVLDVLHLLGLEVVIRPKTRRGP